MNAEDTARALLGLSQHVAKQVDDAPTGVAPGYHPALGGAVLPNGKLRYVAPGTALILDAACGMSTTNTVLGDATPKRLNFNAVTHDPRSQVTTGASWAFTAAAPGLYLVLVTAPLNVATVDWVAGDRADLTLQGDVSATLATWTGMGIVAEPSDLPLLGFAAVTLAAGDVIYAQIAQNSGTDRTVDEAVAQLIVAHV